MLAASFNLKCWLANSQTCNVYTSRSEGWQHGSAAAATVQDNYVTRDWSFPLKYLKCLGQSRKGWGGVFFCNLLVFCDVNIWLCWVMISGSVWKDSTISVQRWPICSNDTSLEQLEKVLLVDHLLQYHHLICFSCHPVYVVLWFLYFCFKWISLFTSFRSFL